MHNNAQCCYIIAHILLLGLAASHSNTQPTVTVPNNQVRLRKCLNAKRQRIYFFSNFEYILLIMLLQLSQLFSLCPSPPNTPVSSSIPPPLLHVHGFVHVSSLASPFPILFLTSLCLFCSDQVCFWIPTPFSLILSLPTPADNPPNDFHTYDSFPVLVVCLVSFCFCFSF